MSPTYLPPKKRKFFKVIIEGNSRTITKRSPLNEGTFLFYKRNRTWYISLPKYEESGAMSWDLDVHSISDILTTLSGKEKIIKLFISTEYQEDAYVLDRESLEHPGSWYIWSKEGVMKKLWLCDVFVYIFGEFPTTLYLKPQKMEKIEEIKGFRGRYRWLSNFWLCRVEYDNLVYTSSEAPYQAAKTTDPLKRILFTHYDPLTAKREGYKLTMRPDWSEVKDQVMYEICKNKFTKNPLLRDKLIATGNAYLEETNTHGDTYWGVCDNMGQNKLGHIIMRIRTELLS